MKTLYTLLILIILIPAQAFGQSDKNRRGYTDIEIISYEHYLDTTPSLLYRYYSGQLDSLGDVVPIRYTVDDPYYYQLYTPLAYYNAPIENISGMRWEMQLLDTINPLTEKLLPYDRRPFTKARRSQEQVSRILLKLYVDHPELVVTTEDQIMSRQVYRDDIEVKISPKATILGLFRPEKMEETVVEAKPIIHKPNFWHKGGSGSLQMTQNYISKNWYKGGESTNSLLANIQYFTNYNDKEKIQFENLFEIKIGFNTVPSDTVREYRINTDVLRLYSKLGIQAANRWYYTISGEFNTQFFRNYKANSDDVVSAFLSPANLIFSVGMDYKLKTRRLNLSVFLSPGAYNLRYVSSDKVDVTAFGLDKGDKVLHDVGSKIQSTLSWKITPSIVLDSRFYYFTNYEKVEAEWENTFNFVLNKYLSTKLFVHARFDDGAKRVEDRSYFQLKELLSFGINYAW